MNNNPIFFIRSPRQFVSANTTCPGIATIPFRGKSDAVAPEFALSVHSRVPLAITALSVVTVLVGVSASMFCASHTNQLQGLP